MKVRERKKGDKVYYYLGRSIRKGNKVIKKEKYLGTKIPEDIDKIKKEFSRDIQNDLNEKLNKIKKHFQEEWKRFPESIREKELEEIAIAFTYNTNAIEGSTITLEESKEIIHDKIAPNKPLRDVKETEAHSKVFLQMLKKEEKVTNNLLLKWHKDIFGETKSDIAGRYRDYLVKVGPHLAPDWQDVEELMKDFLEFINKNKEKMNAVELSARTHYKFEKIHPFGDGNGRIGRLLMNYILWYANFPMLIIEYKKRKSYYRALRKDEDSFVQYYVRRYLTVHKKRYLN